MSRAAALGLSLLLACGATTEPSRPRAPALVTSTPTEYLVRTLRSSPRGSGELALTDATRQRFAVYDSALVALVLLRHGQRGRAGSVLRGLASLQGEDGALPFSFAGGDVESARAYVRAGAVAWVGYAATEYLDAEPGGDARADALRLAHRAASYLLSRQVDVAGDARDGLVTGGSGVLVYELDGGRVTERLRVGPIAWVSTEHNIDAYFFLRALARVTGTDAYARGAVRIAEGLTRAWRADLGQLARGAGPGGERDDLRALDCASWGALFLVANGDAKRAEVAYRSADEEYATRFARLAVSGHRAQARGPVLEDTLLMARFSRSLPAQTWEHLEAVWPEGSAGVALAAWRLGHAERAAAILDALEPLRDAQGALPTATLEVPYLFDTGPSIAGTAWVELVRFELARPRDRSTLWATASVP